MHVMLVQVIDSERVEEPLRVKPRVPKRAKTRAASQRAFLLRRRRRCRERCERAFRATEDAWDQLQALDERLAVAGAESAQGEPEADRRALVEQLQAQKRAAVERWEVLYRRFCEAEELYRLSARECRIYELEDE